MPESPVADLPLVCSATRNYSLAWIKDGATFFDVFIRAACVDYGLADNDRKSSMIEDPAGVLEAL